MGRYRRGGGCRRVDAVAQGEAAPAPVERRQLVGAVAQHRHAERLQQLQGAAEIQHRLGARADDGHGRPGDLRQIRRDVEVRGSAAVDAADTAGRQQPDAGGRGGGQGGRDRGAARRAGGERRPQVPAAHLGDPLSGCQGLDLGGI